MGAYENVNKEAKQWITGRGQAWERAGNGVMMSIHLKALSCCPTDSGEGVSIMILIAYMLFLAFPGCLL